MVFGSFQVFGLLLTDNLYRIKAATGGDDMNTQLAKQRIEYQEIGQMIIHRQHRHPFPARLLQTRWLAAILCIEHGIQLPFIQRLI